MAPSGSWWDGKANISVSASSLVPGIEGQFADQNCFLWCHQSIWGGKGIHGGRQAKALCLARKHECDNLLIVCLEEKLSLWSTWLKSDYQYTNSSAQGYGQLTPVSPCKGSSLAQCKALWCHYNMSVLSNGIHRFNAIPGKTSKFFFESQ